MGQELLKNLNEHEIGIEGFLGQYASQIVNNYFQPCLVGEFAYTCEAVRFYFYPVNLQSVKRAVRLGGNPGLGCWPGRADFHSGWT